MNHQNDVNYQESTSSYYSNYHSEFQLNPNSPPNPQFDHFPAATAASAPPDPSIYYSSDYYNKYPTDHHNPTVQDLSSGAPSYDRNSMPLWYNHQNQMPAEFGGNTVSENVYGYTGGNTGTAATRFDDYGRPLNFGKNEEIMKNDHSVYAYNGGGNNVSKNESSRLPALRFDDYGRPIINGTDNVNDKRASNTSLDGDKMLKATPKLEDVSSGVQKFRVMLLSEGGGGMQRDMDVLCQIGLDGIRILDPATSRTLKVYTLDTVTKWEVLESNIFAFWTKSSIDINPRRVRLKSNSYTTTNLLDMVAAASIQFKEMDEVRVSEQLAEKKKGFPDWINLMKPGNEEKDHWVPDEASIKCTACNIYFGAFVRRHHCRNCGDIFCDKCTQGRIALTAEEHAQQVRVCDQCMAEVTQRLSHVNEVAGRASGFSRHEDLAKKLQEEMEKKRKSPAELKSNVPDERMKEVECPTCTVHLQVEVPTTGSKTIECSVCQHPFLVNAR